MILKNTCELLLFEEKYFQLCHQSSRWAPVLWPKSSKTLFGPVNFSVFIYNYIKINSRILFGPVNSNFHFEEKNKSVSEWCLSPSENFIWTSKFKFSFWGEEQVSEWVSDVYRQVRILFGPVNSNFHFEEKNKSVSEWCLSPSENFIWTSKFKFSFWGEEQVSEWVMFIAKWEFFQLYNFGDNLHLNKKIMMMSAFY
jgi:hypothetical protein